MSETTPQQSPRSSLRERLRRPLDSIAETRVRTEKPVEAANQEAFRYMGGAVLLGLMALPAFHLPALGWWAGLSAAALGWLAAGACIVGGAFLGFLFGIPRTSQPGWSNGLSSGAGRDYEPNTNLEQISDWLTKILIGVGLTQMASIPPMLWEVSGYLGEDGAQLGARAFAMAVILYFLIVGFLLGYLWTRLFLPGALRDADRTEELASEVRALKEQKRIDDETVGLVMRQLHRGTNEPPIPQTSLDQALKTASLPIRVQAFYEAQKVRRIHNTRNNKERIERTIPVFRALASADVQAQYHRNYGQLGYALKDQRAPDWKEAEAMLTQAIELRGDDTQHGWGYYEVNRAICRINLDPAFQRGEASTAATREAIGADLAVAVKSEGGKRIVADDPAIRAWMKLNDLGFPAASDA